MQTPKTIVAWTFGVARLSNAANQPFQICEIRAVQNSFLRAQTKHNFRFAPEIPRLSRQPSARKFQTMTTERNLRRRQLGRFRFGHECTKQGNWLRKTPFNFALVSTTDQSGGNISAIKNLYLGDFVGTLIQFVQLPLGCARVQMCHSRAHELRALRRHNQLEPCNYHLSGVRLAANIQPKNSERQRRINRRLQLLPVYSEHRKP